MPGGEKLLKPMLSIKIKVLLLTRSASFFTELRQAFLLLLLLVNIVFLPLLIGTSKTFPQNEREADFQGIVSATETIQLLRDGSGP